VKVSEAVGRLLVERGVRQVFGLIGSGNFDITLAMVAAAFLAITRATEAVKGAPIPTPARSSR